MNTQNAIYYIEINLICVILMAVLQGQMRQRSKALSTSNAVFFGLIWATILLCVADMVAGCCRGQTFAGARIIIEISNLLYFEALVLVSFLWAIYVELSIGAISQKNQSKIWLIAIPAILFTIVALCNPFTHTIFVIDSNNLYVRNVGVYLHWAITWAYLLFPTVHAALTIAREKNKSRRQGLIPLLYFIIAPVISSAVQMMFYGVSSTQVGITISILLVFLLEQNSQIATDALTGLNSRRGLEKFLSDCTQSHVAAPLSAIMIDVNDFKRINDKFGHLMGDRALIDMANVLRRACEASSKRVFLCRFGGDEFLIVGRGLSDANIAQIQNRIASNLATLNASGRNPYTLSVGIGVAHGDCSNAEDAMLVIRTADQRMYCNKKAAAR